MAMPQSFADMIAENPAGINRFQRARESVPWCVASEYRMSSTARSTRDALRSPTSASRIRAERK